MSEIETLVTMRGLLEKVDTSQQPPTLVIPVPSTWQTYDGTIVRINFVRFGKEGLIYEGDEVGCCTMESYEWNERGFCRYFGSWSSGPLKGWRLLQQIKEEPSIA